MLEILFDILFCLVMFFSFVSISASLFREDEKGEKFIRALDFIMLIFMSVYIIKSLNPFNPDKLMIFVLAVFFTVILLAKNIYFLVCFIKAKRKERRELIEKNFVLISKLVYAPRCDENGNVFFGKTRLLTDLFLAQREAFEKEMRKKGFESLEEYRRIKYELHKGSIFCDEQRPENWKPEKPVLYFDNPFSDLPRIPIRHCSEAAHLFVHVSADKMQNGKDIKFTPEISNCICGGKGELVKYTKCEGKDAYPISYIACNSCGIQTKEYCAKEDNFVIEAWNKIMSSARVEKGNSENDSN